MVRISVPLIIERGFPGRSKSSVSIEELASLEMLDLSSSAINSIDSLEVLDSIRVLILRNNRIKRIENLMFLSKLKELDLSENLISSIDFDSLGNYSAK